MGRVILNLGSTCFSKEEWAEMKRLGYSRADIRLTIVDAGVGELDLLIGGHLAQEEVEKNYKENSEREEE